MSQTLKEGWLSKKGKVVKNWKKRWFVLDGNALSYYEKPGKKHLGTIDLSKATSVDVNNDLKNKNSFKIVLPNVRTYIIVAENEKDCSDWMNILKSCINKKAPEKKNVKNTPQSEHHYSLDDFTCIKVLGRGSFGKVQLVRCNQNGKLYAMKTMNKKLLEESDQVHATIIERDILLQINFPFLVSARYSFQTPEKVFLVLDYVSGGDLFNRIREEEYFNENRTRLYAAEICLALEYLHSLGYVYRDIKSDNFLIDTEGHIKLTDFGLTKNCMNKASDTTTTFCGTPDYMAPEMILDKPYTKDVDWWGYGVLVYEMLVGITPFYDDNPNNVYRSIVYDEPEYPNRMSQTARNFISRLLVKDPTKRLGYGEEDAAAIKKDPFFAGLNWEEVLNKRIEPEWIPKIQSETDTSNFDPRFTAENTGFSFEPGTVAPETQATFQGFTLTNPEDK